MRLKESDLRKCYAPLVAFEGTRLRQKKIINLLIKVGDKIASIDFLVVNAPSAYNAILGRHWLHYMEVVPSTLHQVVRCVSLTRSGTFDIKGDQMMAKQCYSIAIKPCKGTSGPKLILGERKKFAIEEKGKTIISEHILIRESVPSPK